MFANVLDNILPPEQPAKTHDPETYVGKVFKVPMVLDQVADEIQSPIFKNKKKQDKHIGNFAIGLMPVTLADKVDQVPENSALRGSENKAVD